VEPVEGEYNSTYLDIVETIVNMAGALGTTKILNYVKQIDLLRPLWRPLSTWLVLNTKPKGQTGQLIRDNGVVEVKTKEFRTCAQIKHF
jgi:hypothetical protein